MKRAILIDGNNLLFRSYYATAYNGQLMKNSKGFPTNALFGFTNMINKIVFEEKPEYVIVAFDKGHNFRKDLYKDYKAGRIETPNDLLMQFPYAKKILQAMGIVYLEMDNYEADDIIGSFAKLADIDNLYDATIISSDKDLLQLISSDVDVKLLKQSGFIKYNEETFFSDYKIKPIRIIDLKALMGDPSDNIPGVKGVGEKTALTLLQEYESLENVYDNIDKIKGKLKEKLENDKESAFFSKKLATIYKDIELNMTFEDIKKKDKDNNALKEIFEELEFYSFLKNMVTADEKAKPFSYSYYKEECFNNIDKCSFYLELSSINYHRASFVGASIYDGKTAYFIDEETLLNNKNILEKVFVTYDNKKNIVWLNKKGIIFDKIIFDTMIVSYLLELNVKDDIAYLANTKGVSVEFYDNIINTKKPLDTKIIEENICKKAKFLYDTKEELEKNLKENNMDILYNEIEKPLVNVLSSMEICGVKVDKDKILDLKEELTIKQENIKRDIYNMCGEEFNIASPMQLGKILFEKLGLYYPKKNKKGKTSYSTSHEILNKIKNDHPIINMILEYRNITKIITTYMDSLASCIDDDSCIHTIYKQTVARTGRLSSIEPNLQNIPVRSEEGKQIRKGFLSNNGLLLSSDYSQIELRILAHISNDETMIKTFNDDEDIHTKVACDIFNVDKLMVTKNMRRTAKAVIFGIVYGISGYGLGENLELPAAEAKKYIDKYLQMYPSVKKYMEQIVIEAKEKGYVVSLMNRKRTIDELSNTNYLIRQAGQRIALNTPMQATGADIIKKAMVEVYNKLKENNLKSNLVLQVHDELILDCYENEIEDVKKIVKETMENTYKLNVPLKVEIEVGSSWYDC